MLHKSHAVVEPKSNTPLWTQDESIAFECAKEAIGHMIAICSSLIHEEKKKPTPRLKRIVELEQKRSFLADERRNLHLTDKHKIAKIRKEYGSKIKAYECD